ncbi:MAG: hypothetical protein DRJ42_17565, partial [Deltaproteobacteria bacterium]
MKNSTTAAAPQVLWVLTLEQRVDYQADIASAKRPGVKFVFRDSPEDALDELEEINPSLVVVGMTNDEMDGLEFLAMLMRPKLGYEGNAIVLPDLGDPYPPMLQRRDAETGRSSTEEITVADLGKYVEALTAAPEAAQEPAPKAAAKATKPKAAAKVPEATVRRPASVKSERPFVRSPPRAATSDPAIIMAPPTAVEGPGGIFDSTTVRPPNPELPRGESKLDSGVDTLPPPPDSPSPEELLAESDAEMAAVGEGLGETQGEGEAAAPSPGELLEGGMADIAAEAQTAATEAAPEAAANTEAPKAGAAEPATLSDSMPAAALPAKQGPKWVAAVGVVALVVVGAGIVISQFSDDPPTVDPAADPG